MACLSLVIFVIFLLLVVELLLLGHRDGQRDAALAVVLKKRSLKFSGLNWGVAQLLCLDLYKENIGRTFTIWAFQFKEVLVMRVVNFVDLKWDQLSGLEGILTKFFHHLWENLVVQLRKKPERARDDSLAGWREGHLELHDVAQAAEGALIPQLVLVILRLEAVLEGHCARFTILELLVDTHPTNGKLSTRGKSIFKDSGYTWGLAD